MENKPIGIFDSGVGGLTVLTEVRKVLPWESIIYVGDTARVPYGSKPPEALLDYGREIIGFLRAEGAKAVIMACGTSSSTVYEKLCSEFPYMPIFDVIRPGVLSCSDLPQKTRLGLIATSATIKSGLFSRMLQGARPDIDLVVQACPLFAPMVEAGFASSPIMEFVSETYLHDWKGRIDALVLGCTHYPLLTDVLSRVLGDEVKFINLAESTVRAVVSAFDGQVAIDGKPVYQFFVSGNPDDFNKQAQIILNEQCDAKKILLKG